MPKLIMLKGLPGCGKSTYARELIDKYPGRYKRINKDDLRALMDNGKWSKKNEQFVLLMRDTMALAALEKGWHVIIDDTNLHHKHEAQLRLLAKERKAEFEIKDFTDVPIEVCIKQDLKRFNSVGEKVIRDMYNQFLKKPVERVVQSQSLPKAIICDLDGTLCLFGDRNPYERDFENDELNKPVAQILHYMHATGMGYKIIFVSGRNSKFREQTEKFLESHGFSEIIREALYMPRGEKDNRKDAVIKREIFEQHIKGKYYVEFVLDDRNSVVDLWRSLGLPCFQVAEGDF